MNLRIRYSTATSLILMRPQQRTFAWATLFGCEDDWQTFLLRRSGIGFSFIYCESSVTDHFSERLIALPGSTTTFYLGMEEWVAVECAHIHHTLLLNTDSSRLIQSQLNCNRLKKNNVPENWLASGNCNSMGKALNLLPTFLNIINFSFLVFIE